MVPSCAEGGVLGVLTVLALYWSQTVYEVVVLRLLTGFGHAVWNVSRLTYLAEATVSHRRGRAIAIFGGVGRMGSFVGPAAGGALAVAQLVIGPLTILLLQPVQLRLLHLFLADLLWLGVCLVLWVHPLRSE